MMKDDMKNLINSHRSFVMGFSAVWIFVYHLWLMGVAEAGWKIPLGLGYVGVDFFFLLSGMGLIYSIEKRTTREFYVRRLERVFLPYAVVAVMRLVLGRWSLGKFVKNLFFINYFTKNIQSYLWFVPSILIFYLIFPPFYRAFRRAAYKSWMVVAVLTSWLAASLWIMHDPVLGDYFRRTNLYLFTNRFPIFVTGIYLGWQLREKSIKFSAWHWAACVAVFALGVYGSYLTYLQGRQFLLPESYSFLPAYLMALSGVPLTAKLASLLKQYGGKPGRWVDRFFCFFGTYSLEFYCVHGYISGTIKEAAEAHVSPAVLGLMMFAGSVAAALALDFVCRCLRRGIHKNVTA